MSVETRTTEPGALAPETDILQNLPVPAPRRPSLFHQFCQGVVIVALAVASYFFISHFLLQSVRVVGVSMSPNLRDSDRYLLNRWILYLRAPKRTEVVVLRDPVDQGFSVKRVVATAGETVTLRNGLVYVDGHRLEEPYLSPGTPTFPASRVNEQTFVCGKDQYFLLGDNRNSSADSRCYGPVPRRNILGLIIR